MDVLVFSTVPAVARGIGPVEVLTRPRGLAPVITEALNDLAEAGLTVTGPDVAKVHPLARHISRTHVVYRFSRDDSYTARQLIEFGEWAQYCVFRVGNGPFRNLDGENLAAPGQGVKVPVHVDAYARRQRNLRTLRQAGLELNEQIPVVPGEQEIVLRDATHVLYRLGALLVLVDAAEHLARGEFPPADDLVSQRGRVMGSLTSRERSFLADTGRARRASFADGHKIIPEQLRAEARMFACSARAVEALAWAVQLIDLPPQRLRAWDFDLRAWEGEGENMAGETTATLLARSPGLRGVTQLLEAFDLVHILHHGLAEEAKNDSPVSLIATQWVKALAWVVSPNSLWGEAERLL